MKWRMEYQVTTAAERPAQEAAPYHCGKLLRTEFEGRDKRVSQSSKNKSNPVN
jgi:hypothetical protein